MTTAAQINSVMIDRMYRILTKKHGGVGKPEYRLGMSSLSNAHGFVHSDRPILT